MIINYVNINIIHFIVLVIPIQTLTKKCPLAREKEIEYIFSLYKINLNI